MEIQDFLLLLSLGIIVLWTTRLARSKGLNPWLWGVGSALLIAVTWNFSRQFLGPVVMVPLIFLLLFRSPLFRRDRRPASIPCPSCGAPETGGLNFCVQCGWDLSRSGAEATQNEPEAGASMEQAADSQPVDQAQRLDAKPAAQGEAATASAEEPTEAERYRPEPAAEPATAPEPVLAQETPASPEVPAAPASPPTVPPAPARPAPTPANLTERGISLFNQGRFQEP